MSKALASLGALLVLYLGAVITVPQAAPPQAQPTPRGEQAGSTAQGLEPYAKP